MARRNDDVSNDLHIKMCKKIAQITKVVFHLNSKVSENQKVINESKVKHDENIKCLTKSFNAKTVKYEQQLEAAQQQQKVANYIQCDFEKVRLENQYLLTKLNEHQEANYLYKEQLSRAFEEKGFLQNQLLKQKNDTELLIKELIFDLENKMQILLEKKESQYQEEINTIKSDNEKKLSEIDHKNKLLELDNEKKLMEISFFKVNSNDLNIRVQSLEEIKVSLEFEIAKLTKSYNTKINELNLFYENEINMLKVKYVHDNENFQFKEKSQLQDLESKSFNFQNQVRMLQCELSIKEKEMSDLKIEFAFLQDSLGTKNVLLSQLVNELEEKKQCILALEENVKISKNENIAKLDEARLTFKNLEKERDNAMLHMSEKNDAITDLQTALEHVNNEMNKQLKKFKDLQDTSSILLEENKIYQKNIEDEKSSTLMYSELYKNNLAIKEEEIQNLRSELSRIKDKHTFDVSNLEKKLKEDLVLKEEKHLKTVDKLINEHEQKLVSIKNELSLELKQEKLNIVNLHCAQINEKENTITFLKTSIEKHISHNSSLNSQIAGYKEFIRCCVDTEKRLSEEILELKHKLSAAENQNFYLQKCVTDIKNVEQKQAILWQEEKNNFQSSCENLNNEKLLIEIEWQKKIVNEVLKWKLKLKSLQEKKDQELLKAKQALQLFTEKKEQEIFILKEQITQLNSVITRQQNQLSLTLLEQQKTIELLNKNFEEEKVLFENNSRLTITAMDSGHSKEIEDIKLHLIKDKETSISDITQLPYSSSIYSDVSSDLNLEILKFQSSSDDNDWTTLPSENKKELRDIDYNWHSQNVNSMQEVLNPNKIEDSSDNKCLNNTSQLSNVKYELVEINKNQTSESPISKKISSPNISNSSISYLKNIVTNNDHNINMNNSNNTLYKNQTKSDTEIESFQQYKAIEKKKSPVSSATVLNDTTLSNYNASSSFNQESKKSSGSSFNLTSSGTKNIFSTSTLIFSNKMNNTKNNLTEQDVDQAQVGNAPSSISIQNNLAKPDSLFREQQIKKPLFYTGLDILNHGDTSLQTLSVTSDLFDKSLDKKEEIVLNDSGLTRRQWSKMNLEKKEMSTSNFNSQLFTEIYSKSTNTSEMHTFSSSDEKSNSSLSMGSSNISAMKSSWNNEKQQLNTDTPFKTPLGYEKQKKSLNYKPDPIIEQIAYRLNSFSKFSSNIVNRQSINHDKDSDHVKASLKDFKGENIISGKRINDVKHNVSDSKDLSEYKSTSSSVNPQNKIADTVIFKNRKPEFLTCADGIWIPNHTRYVSPSTTPGYKGSSLNQLWGDFTARKSLKSSISSSQIISKLETLQKILAQQKNSMQSLTEGMTPESVSSFSKSFLSPEYVTNNNIRHYKQFNKAASKNIRPKICLYCSKQNKSTNIPSIEESTLSDSASSQSPLTLQIWTQTSKLTEQQLCKNTEEQVKFKSLKMRDIGNNDKYKIQNKVNLNLQKDIQTSSKNEIYGSFHINKKSVYTAWFQSIRSDISDIIPLCKLPAFNVLDDNKSAESQSVDTYQLNLQEAFRQHKKCFISNSKKRVQNVKDRCLEKKRRRKWFAAKRSSGIKRSIENEITQEWQYPHTGQSVKSLQKQQNKKRLNFQKLGFQQLEQERIARLKANRMKMKLFDMKIRQRFISHKLTMKSYPHVIQN